MHIAVHNSVIYRAVQCSVQFDNVTSIELTIGDIQMVLQYDVQYSTMYNAVCTAVQNAVQYDVHYCM